MSIKQIQTPSAWWKFDDYEIHNGTIRPAAKARLRVWDPWSCFNNVVGHYRTVRTLWGELAELDRNLREDASRTLSREGETKILAWSNEYGLLGLLPIRVQSIELPAQYIGNDMIAPLVPGLPRARRALRRSYFQIAGSWVSQSKATLEPWPASPAQSARRDLSTIYEWNEFEYKAEQTVHAIQPYYREQVGIDRFPCPFSKEFWPLYQEPVQEWTNAVASFVESLQLVSDHAHELREKGRFENESAGWALWRLRALASKETASFSFGPRLLEDDACSASLLSALARMFLLDIQAGRRLLHCDSCRRIFVSNEIKAKYCQISCRIAAQGRRQRAQRKEKERKLTHLKQRVEAKCKQRQSQFRD